MRLDRERRCLLRRVSCCASNLFGANLKCEARHGARQWISAKKIERLTAWPWSFSLWSRGQAKRAQAVVDRTARGRYNLPVMLQPRPSVIFESRCEIS